MNTVFLIAQGLLGLFFLMGGLRFTFQPIATLAKNKDFKFVLDLPKPFTRFIGVIELAAGLALLFPILTGVARWSTPLVALGVALLMVCAATFHIKRREYKMLPLNSILFAFALFVVVGRWSWIGV